jgi:carbon monoxide dehydrogenase subunit G
MELTNQFEVATDLDDAWRILTDIERIAPCLPGAELREIEGDEFRGVVKVKVGPITTEYSGAAHFVERDADAHRAVLRADGRETKGQGNASATITAQLEPSEKGTKVSVETNLAITGKVAQFGRGVLADISAKLLDQFVDNLESTVLAGDKPPAASRSKNDGSAKPAAATASAPAEERAESAGVRKLEPEPAEPVDLVDVAGVPIAKRLVPVVILAAVVALVALIRRLSRR